MDRLDDVVLHIQRATFLEKLLEAVPLTAKKTTVSRMMYAARTVNKETDKFRLTDYHSELLREVAGSKMEGITGFLLIYPTCLVEAETQVLIAILKVLKEETHMIDTICVFAFTEEMPYRIFESWMTGFIISANLGPYDPQPKNTLASAMSSFNINMLKWGRQLSEMDKEQQLMALDSLRTAAEEHLTDDAGILYGILLCEDVPRLQDVLDLFDARLVAVLGDSDIIWPKPRPVYISKLYKDPSILKREEHNRASLAASRKSLAKSLAVFGDLSHP